MERMSPDLAGFGRVVTNCVVGRPLLSGIVTVVVITLASILWYKRKQRNASLCDTWASHVYPHSALEQITRSVFWVRGSMPRAPPRNMVIFVLSEHNSSPPNEGEEEEKGKENCPSRGLLIHSCIAVNEDTLAQIKELGEPRVLVVPNGMHRADAGVWKARFPSLKVICPRAAAKKVAAVVPVGGFCEDVLPGLGVGVLEPQGLTSSEELVYILSPPPPHKKEEEEAEEEENEEDIPRKVYVFTDLLFNLGPEAGFIARLLGSTGDGEIPKVTPLLLRCFVANRDIFREWLREAIVDKASEQDIAVVGHGNLVVGGCKAKLATAVRAI